MTESGHSQSREDCIAALLLFLGVFLVYLPAMNGDFIFDDLEFVKGNPRLRNFEGLIQIWLNPKANLTYYPLTFTTFWIEYQIWQLWTTGYHLVNIALHGLNAILLWALFRKLAIPGAWVAAAIFAFHPVQVESVAWISQRKNLLSGFFYLLTILCYLRFSPLHLVTSQPLPRNWKAYSLVLFCFLCALLSKTVTCSLPATLVLLTWWKLGKVHVRDILPLTPLFVMGISASMLSAFLEWHPEVVGATGSEWNFTLVERILIAGRAVWFYLTTLIWPVNHIFIYPRWIIDMTIWWQYVFPTTLGIILFLLVLYRSRIGYAPLIVLLFFIGTLFPVLGFLDFYLMRHTFVADHFQYLPCISIIAGGVGWFWNQQVHFFSNREKQSTGVEIFQRSSRQSLLSACVIVMLVILTWHRAAVYAESTSLWADTIEKNPKGWIAHNNLGWELLQRKEYQAALPYLEKAVELGPYEGHAHSNLSTVLFEIGNIDRSLRHAKAAVQYTSDSAAFMSNLSMIYWRIGDLSHAVHFARLVLDKRRLSAEVYYNVGALALQEVPTPEAFSLAEAVSYLERAVEMDPNAVSALHLLAWLRATAAEHTIRDGKKALELAEKACLRTGYRDPNLLDTLAAAYAEIGQFHVAADAAQTAAELAKNSGRVRLEGRIQERIALYKEMMPYYNTVMEKFPF